jgi:hypothetical protein
MRFTLFTLATLLMTACASISPHGTASPLEASREPAQTKSSGPNNVCELRNDINCTHYDPNNWDLVHCDSQLKINGAVLRTYFYGNGDAQTKGAQAKTILISNHICVPLETLFGRDL